MAIGFWEALLDDVGYFERRAINEAAEQIDLLRASSSQQQTAVHKQLRRLYALDKAQSKELARMRAMIKTLATLLIESGVVEEKLVQQRMEAALVEMEDTSRPTPRPVPVVDPYRGAFRGTEPASTLRANEPSTKCGRCGDTVLLRRTQITDEGNVCDDCFYSVVRHP